MTESILKSQTFYELLVKFTEAKRKLVEAEQKDFSLSQDEESFEHFYQEAKNELSKVAIERAMQEAEGNEVTEEIQERYHQALENFVKKKQDYQNFKQERARLLQVAHEEVKKIKQELEPFICTGEEDLIAEKTRLQNELNKLKENYEREFYKSYDNLTRCGYDSDTAWRISSINISKSDKRKTIEYELELINNASSIICEKKGHMYELVSTKPYSRGSHMVREEFICKRCGESFSQLSSWVDD